MPAFGPGPPSAAKFCRSGRNGRPRVSAGDLLATLDRYGHPLASCRIKRLMRRTGFYGVAQLEGPRTSIPGPFADRPKNVVDRYSTASASDCRWMADIALDGSNPLECGSGSG